MTCRASHAEFRTDCLPFLCIGLVPGRWISPVRRARAHSHHRKRRRQWAWQRGRRASRLTPSFDCKSMYPAVVSTLIARRADTSQDARRESERAADRHARHRPSAAACAADVCKHARKPAQTRRLHGHCVHVDRISSATRRIATHIDDRHGRAPQPWTSLQWSGHEPSRRQPLTPDIGRVKSEWSGSMPLKSPMFSHASREACGCIWVTRSPVASGLAEMS